MRRLGYLIMVLAVVAGIFTACGGPKAPATVPGTTTGPATTPATGAPAPSATQPTGMQQVIEAAKKEGQVVFWTHSISNADKIIKPFKEMYPFLEVKIWDARGAEIINKMMEETKAGRYTVDVVTTGEIDFPHGTKETLFVPYDWPYKASSWPYQPKHTYYVNFSNSTRGTTYNKELISAADAPKTWEELNNSKWRGKAIMSTSANEVPLAFAYFWSEGGKLNWDKSSKFWNDVVSTVRPRAERGFTGSNELHAAGAHAIFIMNSAQRAMEYMWKGAPLAVARAPKMHLEPRSMAVAKNAPHPNAARLWVDYLLSVQGQLIYANETVNLAVNPEAAVKARSNLEFSSLGIELVAIPVELFTDENVSKSSDIWLKALGREN